MAQLAIIVLVVTKTLVIFGDAWFFSLTKHAVCRLLVVGVSPNPFHIRQTNILA